VVRDRVASESVFGWWDGRREHEDWEEYNKYVKLEFVATLRNISQSNS
jgi:hypothetical protein